MPISLSLRRRLVPLLGAILLAVTACSGGSGTSGTTAPAGSGAAGGDAATTGTFTLGVNQFFLAHLMPGNSGGSNVNNALFTPLTQLDMASGAIVNAVAESIESTDQTNWTIKIKDGWTFHNGEPVTAKSFADSWNATADPKNAMTSNLEMKIFQGYDEMNPASGAPTATTLSGVKVVDDKTLQVTLTGPQALFPALLSSSSFAPIPSTASADFAAFDQNPIGNGPFKVTGGGMTPGAQQLVLERYADYGGEPAKSGSVTIRAYQDSTAIYTDFQAGALDLALVDGNDLSSAKAEFPNQVVDVEYPAVVTLGFPTWDSRFANPKVRQALSMAVDRQSIVDALLKGNGTPATGLAPSVLPGGGEADCSACVYDVAAAKTLLAEAGGFPGTLTLYTYTDPTNQAIVEAIANQLRTNLGIDALSETQPVDQLYQNFAAKSLTGAFVIYTGTNIPHLYGLVNALFTKSSLLNATGYESATVTDLLAKAQAASTPEDFTTLVQQASTAALDDLQSAPLYQPKGGLLHTTRLDGVEPELLGGANLATITVTG